MIGLGSDEKQTKLLSLIVAWSSSDFISYFKVQSSIGHLVCFFDSGNSIVFRGNFWCPCTCPVFVLVIVIILLQIVLVTVSPVWQRPDGGISLEPTQTLRPTQWRGHTGWWVQTYFKIALVSAKSSTRVTLSANVKWNCHYDLTHHMLDVQ